MNYFYTTIDSSERDTIDVRFKSSGAPEGTELLWDYAYIKGKDRPVRDDLINRQSIDKLSPGDVIYVPTLSVFGTGVEDLQRALAKVKMCGAEVRVVPWW